MIPRDDMLQQIARDVADLRATSAKQEANLAEHMRRTAAAETRVDTLETFVTETRAYMRGVKFLGIALGGLVALAAGIAAILGVVHGW